MNFYKEYIKKPFNLFLKTFKNKKLLTILIIDIIFYIIFYLGFKVFMAQVKNIMNTLQDLNLNILQDLTSVDAASANILFTQLQSFIISTISAVLIFALFTIVTLTLIKGYQWGKITKNKLELFDYVKLLILNIIWFIIWIIILVIPFLFIETQAYLTHIHYLIIPLLYFSLFLYMSYAQTKKVGKALIAPIKQGLLKLHKYISPLIIITIFFILPILIFKFFNLNWTLQLIKIQSKIINQVITLIVPLIVLAVYKLYFYAVSKEV